MEAELCLLLGSLPGHRQCCTVMIMEFCSQSFTLKNPSSLGFSFFFLLLTSLRQVKGTLTRPRRWLSVLWEGVAEPAQTGVPSFLSASLSTTPNPELAGGWKRHRPSACFTSYERLGRWEVSDPEVKCRAALDQEVPRGKEAVNHSDGCSRLMGG